MIIDDRGNIKTGLCGPNCPICRRDRYRKNVAAVLIIIACTVIGFLMWMM